MLAREVWKETARGTPLDNVMDVHMNRLRRKVDELHSDRRLIHTVRGVRFIAPGGRMKPSTRRRSVPRLALWCGACFGRRAGGLRPCAALVFSFSACGNNSIIICSKT